MRVMQCWDDGDVDDIRLIDILKPLGAKATFNINPGGWKSERRVAHVRNGYEVLRLPLDEMKDVYKGFRVAGHSMTHPTLTKIDPDWAYVELVECKKFIAKHFGFAECGMAYPNGPYNDTVKDLVRKAGYRYARTVENTELKINIDDPMALKTNCHFNSPDFWKKFEAVRAIDGDFYFWGHTFELFGDQTRWDALRAQMEKIASTPGVVWIDVIDMFI